MCWVLEIRPEPYITFWLTLYLIANIYVFSLLINNDMEVLCDKKHLVNYHVNLGYEMLCSSQKFYKTYSLVWWCCQWLGIYCNKIILWSLNEFAFNIFRCNSCVILSVEKTMYSKYRENSQGLRFFKAMKKKKYLAAGNIPAICAAYVRSRLEYNSHLADLAWKLCLEESRCPLVTKVCPMLSITLSVGVLRCAYV